MVILTQNVVNSVACIYVNDNLMAKDVLLSQLQSCMFRQNAAKWIRKSLCFVLLPRMFDMPCTWAT